jgi:hypothetical protein
LRQGLVDRVERNISLDAGSDVEVDFCVARQRKQNFLRAGTLLTTTL